MGSFLCRQHPTTTQGLRKRSEENGSVISAKIKEDEFRGKHCERQDKGYKISRFSGGVTICDSLLFVEKAQRSLRSVPSSQ